ncbi:MAG: hypothetical protein ACOC34_00980 [Thermotogota bacterium]
MKYLIVENEDQMSYINVENIESFDYDKTQDTVFCTCNSGAQHALIKADRHTIDQYLAKLVRNIKSESIINIKITDFNKQFMK